MDATPTTDGLSLSAAELQRRLDALTPSVPLSAAERETLREIMEALQSDNLKAMKEVLREWNFQKMRREIRAKQWPLYTLAASVLVPCLGWFATWIGPKLPALFK